MSEMQVYHCMHQNSEPDSYAVSVSYQQVNRHCNNLMNYSELSCQLQVF